jgi:hypothetical protein
MVRAILPGGASTEPVDLVDLQGDLLRFSDHFMSSTIQATETLQRNGKPIEHFERVKIKVKLASETLAIVSSANTIGTLVDMVMMTSAARAGVEDYWMPKVYGPSAMPLLQVFIDREKQIWILAEGILAPPQQTELREAIKQWRTNRAKSRGQSLFEVVASLQLVDEVKEASRKQSSSLMPSSVFKLLDVDPLAGLDPATRELTETRLFGDRALFIGQRMPQLIEWQLELLAARTLNQPQVGEMVNSASKLAATGDRISQTAEQLPNLISSEREKLLNALKTEKQGLLELSRQVSQTLGEGSRMADSTQKALKTYSDLMTQIEKQPKDPNSEPFRIKDYAETALEINRMSQRLIDLLRALQPTLDPANFAKLTAQVDALTQQTQTRSQAVVDYAFQRAILLVAVSCLLLLATALLYQFLNARLFRASSRQEGP